MVCDLCRMLQQAMSGLVDFLSKWEKKKTVVSRKLRKKQKKLSKLQWVEETSSKHCKKYL